jgi:hypothetical protein
LSAVCIEKKSISTEAGAEKKPSCAAHKDAILMARAAPVPMQRSGQGKQDAF